MRNGEKENNSKKEEYKRLGLRNVKKQGYDTFTTSGNQVDR